MTKQHRVFVQMMMQYLPTMTSLKVTMVRTLMRHLQGLIGCNWAAICGGNAGRYTWNDGFTSAKFSFSKTGVVALADAFAVLLFRMTSRCVHVQKYKDLKSDSYYVIQFMYSSE